MGPWSYPQLAKPRNGRYAGQLHWVHNMAVDSRGNVYTTEVDTAKRVQKFVFQGLFPVD